MGGRQGKEGVCVCVVTWDDSSEGVGPEPGSKSRAKGGLPLGGYEGQKVMNVLKSRVAHPVRGK